MIGRQVVFTNRSFTLVELEQFMQQYWNKEQYYDFFVGRPTPASIEEYILLPATHRFMVIIYPRMAKGLFSKENKVILSVCETPVGVIQRMSTIIPTHNMLTDIWQVSKTMSLEQERKGPAEEILQKYATHMRQLLNSAGFLK